MSAWQNLKVTKMKSKVLLGIKMELYSQLAQETRLFGCGKLLKILIMNVVEFFKVIHKI